jgi:hypothetical protein
VRAANPVSLSCWCEQCQGREIPVTPSRWRQLNRLPWGIARQVIHQLVDRGGHR